MTQTSDKERIEAAAEEIIDFVRNDYGQKKGCYLPFDINLVLKAVAWRDKNPSPEVEALVEAVEIFLSRVHDVGGHCDSMKLALTAYKARLGKGE